MLEFFSQVQENLGFFLSCILIVTVLALIAKLADRYLPAVRHVRPARRITIIAICSAIATVLHVFDFPVPFLAPGFYKLDFSELPVMLCGFYLGPSATVMCEALKILLKLLIKGTSTAFVGDMANFVVGVSMVVPAALIYHLRKTKDGAMLGLAVGTLIMTVFGSAFNAVYLIPKFSELFHLPLENILAMGRAINPHITSLTSFVFMCVMPLNLVKGAAISVLTMLLYKRVARPLFSK